VVASSKLHFQFAELVSPILHHYWIQTTFFQSANLYEMCLWMAGPINSRTVANFLIMRRPFSFKNDIWRCQWRLGPRVISSAAIGNMPTRKNKTSQPQTRIRSQNQSSRIQRPDSDMSDEELREINGIKPNVWLEDGAEREVSSQSRYELKSTALLVF
jgi:hypothetical protein